MGVVGRTGSGKSTLLLSILRMLDPWTAGPDDEATGGMIRIDGEDIDKVSLRRLRSSVTVIPQVFSSGKFP